MGLTKIVWMAVVVAFVMHRLSPASNQDTYFMPVTCCFRPIQILQTRILKRFTESINGNWDAPVTGFQPA